MKRFWKYVIMGLCIMTAMLGIAGCGSEKAVSADRGNWQVASPDGSITADVRMDADGVLTYTVKKDDTTVVEPSRLGFTILEDDLRIVTLEDVSNRRVSGEYENISGKRTTVAYDCNELTLTLKGYVYYMDVILRAYDDGYAFRYVLRSIDDSEQTVEVISEDSEFALPEDSTVWAQLYQSTLENYEIFSYERTYENRKSNNLAGEKLAFPVLYQAGNSDIYSLVTESDLIGSGFYGSFMAETEENQGTGKFGLIHNPARAAEDDCVISTPFTSPWRTGIVGDLKTVEESEMVEKLFDDCEYWKPEDYDTLSSEEQEIYNYDWVDAGASSWSWLVEWKLASRGEKDYDMHKEYVDLAADMGWSYATLDAGWDYGFNSTQFADFEEFIEYANSKNVKIIVWCDSLADFAYGNLDVLKAKLDKWSGMGISGIKIDFFDGQNALESPHHGEDMETIEWYEHIYQECAKRKMVVNCHGCNKPTGERRRYPNVFTREGIRGNEFTIDSNTTVNELFIRGVVGPSDFTPRVYPFTNIKLTVAHQMALAVLLEGGSPTMSDFATTYYLEDFADFYSSIPALRDETVFLCGEPDGYYCAAIKAGDEWFVAGVNSYGTVDLDIDLDFLGDDSYEAVLYQDAELDLFRTQQIDKKTETEPATKDSTLSVTMYENGGFIYHLKKQ